MEIIIVNMININRIILNYQTILKILSIDQSKTKEYYIVKLSNHHLD